MDKHLSAFIEVFGNPTHSSPIADKVIEKFKGKLPDKLLEYWKALGFSGFLNGLFWVTNPDEYEAELDLWLSKTRILEEDAYYVIGRSGFGDLYLWGEKNGYKYVVNAANGWVLEKDGDRAEIQKSGSEGPLKRFIAVLDPYVLDQEDADGNPLFETAVKKYGPLSPEEVFAFEPALFAAGTTRLENIFKRNVHAYLQVLAQLEEPQVLSRHDLTRKAFGA